MRKFGNIIIARDHTRKITEEDYHTIDEEYEAGLRAGKQLILGTLPARSGTMWLCDIFGDHDNATGITERDFEAESFYRYIKYNNLSIDTAGIITMIKHGIIEDWKKGDVALVFSPFFSHGLKELYDILRPTRIIIGINDPQFTVQSMYNKGFFKHYYVRDNADKALGFQPAFQQSWSYLFGRLVPNGDFYQTWQDLTRIGKIAWWGNMVTMEIDRQLKHIPDDKVFLFHLKDADQNYEYYKKMASDFGLAPLLSEKHFLSIKWRRVKKAHNETHEWSDQERHEFQLYTKEWHELYHKLFS